MYMNDWNSIWRYLYETVIFYKQFRCIVFYVLPSDNYSIIKPSMQVAPQEDACKDMNLILEI